MGKEPNKFKKIPTNHCAVPNCINTTNTSNVTFHKFPTIRAIREKWKTFCGTDYSDYLCKKYMLCSAHFNSDCFDSDGKSRSLNSNSTLKELAIPTINKPTQMTEIKLNFVDQNQQHFVPDDPLIVSRCRVCLATSSDLKNIFSGGKLNYASKIEKCVQIDIKEDDTLPQNICVQCIQLLENAYNFKILCEQSNQTLKLEQINRIEQIKTEKCLNKNELNIDIQTSSIKEEFGLQQYDEVEKNSDTFFDDNNDQSNDIDEPTNDGLIHKEIEAKIDSHSANSDISDDSNDWVVEKTNQQKNKQTKEVKISKLKNKRKQQPIRGKMQCDECGCITKGLISLEDHKRAVHQGITDFYKCEQCSKGFKTKNGLQFHLKIVHELNPVVCDTCGKNFKNNILLKNHITQTHIALKRFKCDYCPYMAVNKHIIRNHSTIHTGERKYKCHLCDMTFRSSFVLSTHVKGFHLKIRPVKCDICGKSYSSKSRLIKHGVIHTGFKPYPCPLCPNVTYSWYEVLVAHQRSLHPGLKLQTEGVMYKKFMQDKNSGA